MLTYKDVGHTITIDLPYNTKYEGYLAECRYRFDSFKGKYLVSMWIRKRMVDYRYKVDSVRVDTQYLSGTRDTIRENLCLVVDHACRIGFFDPYISRLDHILAQQHSENSYSYDVPQTMSQEGVYHV